MLILFENQIALLFILFIVAVIAAIMDAIAGGGGLIVVPILLLLGLGPLETLGTNKLQAAFGTLTSSINYSRKLGYKNKGFIKLFITSLIASITGATFIVRVPTELLLQIIPVLLIAVAIFFAIQKDLNVVKESKLSFYPFLIFIILISLYDSLIGPGAGSFYMIAFVALRGMHILEATLNTKIVNFASNFGSLIIFALLGYVNYRIGIVMCAGQVIGSYIGSNLTVKKGSRIIKPTLITVSILMSLRLLFTS